MKKIFRLITIIVLLVIICFNNNVYAFSNLSINAKASLIVELNTGKIIYEDNIYEKNYPASMTKILTAIIVLENCELDDIANVSQSAISNIPQDYVITPLYVGERISIKDLLYALLLKSANDAAYVLAEHVAGSVDNFSEMMNKKAIEIGCKNSHFVNPNGIHDDNHYTTAYDMFLIAKYAMQNEKFAEIVSKYQYTLPVTNKYSKNDRVMENTNFFVCPNSKYYDKNVNGVKTGTTQQAGNCLIANITKNGFNVITIVLGAKTKESRFSETKKMIEYTFDNYTITEFYKKGDIIKSIEVKNATEETKNLNLVISDDITIIHNVNVNIDEIQPDIVLNDNITAPINKGQEIGTFIFKIEGEEYSAKLLAEKDAEPIEYYNVIIVGNGLILLFLLIIMKIKTKKRKNKKEN